MRIIILAVVFIGLLLLYLPNQANAQNSIKEFIAILLPSKRIASADKKFKSYRSIKLPELDIYSFVKGKSRSSFRLRIDSTLKWDIDLQPSTLALSQYKRTLITPNGKKSEWLRADYLYRGITRGKHGGKVRLTVKEGFFYGTISSNGKEYIIEPATQYGVSSKNEYLLYTSDDVIADTSLKCGVADENTLDKLKAFSISKKEQSPDDSIICRTVPIVQVADYLMLEQFNFNIDSLETFLFSNLNISESVFNELNFGPDSTTDLGNDQIRFEMLESVISTCYTCDILSISNSSSNLFAEAKLWIQKSYPESLSFISQFWSPRRLYSSAVEVVGLSGNLLNENSFCVRSMNLLRYLPNGASTDYRFIAAHEIGHSLGAEHDDAIVPEVNRFIMNSYVVTTATRFSRLEDFRPYFTGTLGDVQYSSQLMFKEHFLANDRCYTRCTDVQNLCGIPDGLKIQYGKSSEGLLIKWQGSGSFIVLVKEGNRTNSKTKDSLLVTGNQFVLKDLSSCKIYSVQIGRVCTENSIAWGVTKLVNSTQLDVINKGFRNIRSSLFDLKLEIAHNHNKSGRFEILLDNKSIPYVYKESPQEIVIENLFADGARHKAKINSIDEGGNCGTTFYIDFPYYRNNSTILFQSNFNECSLGEWRDSMLTTFAPNFRTPLFYVQNENKNYYFEPGSFDSTCFAYYASDVVNSEIPIKKFSLTSPAIDISKHSNLLLSFDYQYWVNSASKVLPDSYFSVEAFDGLVWKELKKVTTPAFVGPTIPWRMKAIWDTLPLRLFLDVSEYKNKNFQIRFAVDNGTNENYQFNQYFLALDNVRIDGYPAAPINEEMSYTLMPNPASKELFLRFPYPVSYLFKYRILDISGKTIKEGSLHNDRVDISLLPKGMYVFQLFYKSNLISNAHKFLKL